MDVLGQEVMAVRWPGARHLKDLLRDAERSDGLFFEAEGIIADFSRQRITTDKTLPVMPKAFRPVITISLVKWYV